MDIKKRISKINSSPRLIAVILLAVFLLMFVCNQYTHPLADDFRYCFSFADDKPIASVSDIFNSMAAHRLSMNGRLTAHFLVQFFLMLRPGTVFKLDNSLFFALLVYLIYHISRQGAKHNAVLLLSVFGCLWILQPEFGQVFLWLDGSINYLWCAVFCLLYLLPFVNHFMRGKNMSTWKTVLFSVYSMFVGAYSENSSVAVIFMLMLFILLCRFYLRERVPVWMYISLVCAFIGFILMMTAPAESVNKSAEFSLSVLWSNFIETGSFYLRFWPLLLVYAMLLFLSHRQKLEAKHIILSLCFFLGSLAGHFVLTFAMYCTGRSTYIALALLLCAVGILFVPLFEMRYKRLLAALCAICLVSAAYCIFIGVRDILNTSSELTYNVNLIAECKAKGEKDIQLPMPYSDTKYSALSGLCYLNTEDANDWVNVYMAKYFGVDSIIGY